MGSTLKEKNLLLDKQILSVNNLAMVMCPTIAGRLPNSTGPDQVEQFDVGLLCLLRQFYPSMISKINI